MTENLPRVPGIVKTIYVSESPQNIDIWGDINNYIKKKKDIKIEEYVM